MAIIQPALPGLELSVTRGLSMQEPKAPQLWWVKELPIIGNRVDPDPREMESPPAALGDEPAGTGKERSENPQLREMIPLAFIEHVRDWNELLCISQQSHAIALQPEFVDSLNKQ